MASISNAHLDMSPPDEQQSQEQPEQPLHRPQMSAQQQQQQQMNILLARMRHMGLGGVSMAGLGESHLPQQQQQQHPGLQPPPLGAAPGAGGLPLTPSMEQMGDANVPMSPQNERQQQILIHQRIRQQQAQQMRLLAPNGQQQQAQAAYNPDESRRIQPAPGEITINGFDPSVLYHPRDDIDFERDFARWFGPDDNALQMADSNWNANGSLPPPAMIGRPESLNPTGNPPAPNGQQQQTSVSTPGMQSGGGGMGPDMNLFDPGTSTHEMYYDSDPSQLFRPDSITNFERDFGQWLTPDDNALDAVLDMK